tara:strand:+ start:484 stop:852 length:369 start_codon:yes stop_codon:yes gene_type:complete
MIEKIEMKNYTTDIIIKLTLHTIIMNILAKKVKVSPEERKRLRELYHPAFAGIGMGNYSQKEITDSINELSSTLKILMDEMNYLRNENEYLKKEVVELRNKNEKLKANAVKLKTRIIMSKRE